jgi:hypothetical protein
LHFFNGIANGFRHRDEFVMAEVLFGDCVERVGALALGFRAMANNARPEFQVCGHCLQLDFGIFDADQMAQHTDGFPADFAEQVLFVEVGEGFALRNVGEVAAFEFYGLATDLVCCGKHRETVNAEVQAFEDRVV